MNNTTNKQNIPTTSNLMEQIEATLKTLSQFDDVVFKNMYVSKKIKIYQVFFKNLQESLIVINNGLAVVSQYLITISELDIKPGKLDKNLKNIADSLNILNSYSSYIFSLINSITSLGVDDILFNVALLNVNVFKKGYTGTGEVKNILEFYAVLTDFMLYIQEKINTIRPKKIYKGTNKLLRISVRIKKTLKGILNVLTALPGGKDIDLISNKITALQQFADTINTFNKLNLVGTMFNAIMGFVSIFIGVKTIYDIVKKGKADVYLYKGGILVKMGTVNIGKIPTATQLLSTTKQLASSILLFTTTTAGMVPVYKSLEIIKKSGVVNSLIGFWMLQKGIFEMYKFTLVLHLLFSKGQYLDKKTNKIHTIGLLDKRAKKNLFKNLLEFFAITTSITSITLLNVLILKNIGSNITIRTFVAMHLLFYIIKFLYTRLIDLAKTKLLTSKQLETLIKLNLQLHGFLFSTLVMASILRNIGTFGKATRKGLRVLYNIYNGNILGWTKGLYKIPSVIQVMSSIDTSAKGMKKFNDVLIASLKMTAFVAVTSMMLTPLLLLGLNFAIIVIGLMTLRYTYKTLLEIINIIATDGKKVLTKQNIKLLFNATVCLSMIVAQVMMLGIISVMQPILLMSLAGLAIYMIAVEMMLFILMRQLGRYTKKKITDAGVKLAGLTGIFANVVEMLGAVMAGMVSIEVSSAGQGWSLVGTMMTLLVIVNILLLVPLLMSKFKAKISVGMVELFKLAIGIITFVGLLFLINITCKDIEFITILTFVGSAIILIGLFSILGYLSTFVLPLLTPLLLVSLALFAVIALLSTAINIAQKTNTEDAAQKLCNIIYAFFDPIGLLASIPLETLITAGFKAWRLKRVSIHLSEMAKYISDIANLTIATKWDKDGNPIEYKQMKPDDFQKAALNADNIANTIVTCVTSFNDDKIKISDVRKFKRIKKIARQLSKMARQVANIASLKFATKWNKDGDPIEFEAMDKSMFKLASENSLEIVKTIINTVGGVDGKAGLDLEVISKKSVKKFRQIKRISNQMLQKQLV